MAEFRPVILDAGVHKLISTADVLSLGHLHLGLGGAGVGQASLKMDAGAVLAAPESGAFENDGTHLYWTDAGLARHILDTGAESLAATYNIGGAAADQTLTLKDAKGGAFIVDGTDAGFTGTYAMQIKGTASAAALNISAGDLLLAANTVVWKRSAIFLHDYADPTAYGYNVFLGYNAGNLTMSPGGGWIGLSSTNTGVGAYTLSSLTTGYSNFAGGFNALASLTTGYSNVAIGVNAMKFTTQAYRNISIGLNTMSAVTTGFDNVAMGIGALASLTDGDINIAIGSDALSSGTHIHGNIAIGANALLSLVAPAEGNNAYGVLSLAGTTTGIYNVGVGEDTGQTDIPANCNHTGKYNTWIGTQAGPASATQMDFTIGLGYLAKPAQSRQCVIGNPVWITTMILHGSVGLGVVAPGATKFYVLDTAAAITAPIAGSAWDSINFAQSTLTLTAGGTAPSELAFTRIAVPILTQTAGAAYTIPISASMILDGPPSATNAGGATPVLTQKYVLYAKDGNIRSDGTLFSLGDENAPSLLARTINLSGGNRWQITGAATGKLEFTDVDISASPMVTISNSGNLILGAGAAGATAAKCFALSNSATAPSASVDLAHLYAADIAAGRATLAIYAEEAVNADVGLASTHSFIVYIDGAKYKLMLVLVP